MACGNCYKCCNDPSDPTVNVKCCGAKGDGVTEDLAAIQMAINSLPETGGTVYFPPGKYVIKETSNNPGKTKYNIEIYNRQNIRLVGAGRDQSILFDPDTHPLEDGEPTSQLIALGIVYAYESNNLEFEHLGFLGVAPDLPDSFVDNTTDFKWGHGGVVLIGCDDVLVQHCKFENLWAGSFYTGPSSASGGGNRIRANGNDFRNSFSPFVNTAGGSDHEVHGNYFYNCGSPAIECSSNRLTVTHNKIELTVPRGTNAVQFGTSKGIVFGWNTITDAK